MNILSSHDSFLKSHPMAQSHQTERVQAFKYATEQGLPTKKQEDWHYTSTKLVADKDFDFSIPELSHDVLAQVKAHLNPEFLNIVYVDGIYNQTLSAGLPPGMVANEAFSGADFKDSFDALNKAYATSAQVLTVKPETSVEKPVNFVFFSTSQFKGVVAPRLAVKVGKRSSLCLLESYVGLEGAEAFANSFLKIEVEESAKLTYIRVQNDSLGSLNMGRTEFSLARAATLESLSMSLGGVWSRHTLDLHLNGEMADAKILGLYCASGTQHMDHTTCIDHAVGSCNTEQLYKGILDDKSRTIFNGKVLIQKDAQKANSAQLNNNLLLSSTAEADSKPNLEIYADDVKASHGSTVGQLSKEEIFYLQSRAIPREQAVQMLSVGFVSEVLYKISNESLHPWLQEQLSLSFARLKVKS